MKAVTMQDLDKLSFVSDPRISPDGAYAAYTVSRADTKENGYQKTIWLYRFAKGEGQQLTFLGREGGYAWDDARTLLFAAERREEDKPKKNEKKTAFYRLPVDGGEARPAFSVPLEAEKIEPLGGGRYLITASVDLNEPAADMDEILREDEKDYHVVEEVPLWANGSGFVSRRRSALYLFEEEAESLTKLTEDFLDVSAHAVKGSLLAYAGCDYRDVRSRYDTVKLLNLGTGEKRTLVEPGQYGVSLVAFAGGSLLLAMSDYRPWGIGQMHDIYRYDLSGKELCLAARPGKPLGSALMTDAAYGGGKKAATAKDELYFLLQDKTKTGIYRMGEGDALEELLSPQLDVETVDATEGRIVFTAAKACGLQELYALEGGVPKRLSHHNDAFLAGHYVAEAKHIPFTDSDGAAIDGWVLEPEGLTEKSKVPAVLEIHGGPRCTYTDVFFHEMQVLAGKGYLVFFCNPRGSEGYGEEFADLRGKYGTIDYRDLMEFTDHVLSLYPQIDVRRLCACGGSYGGFMCNWIEGHTDRFAAIASQRSISNWVADFGSSEIGISFDENEMAATPWNGMEKMWEQSPLKYADRAKTPILFIHSLCDYNCTIDQGVEMFTAMKYFGVPSRMCLFEGENHSLSRSGKPRHRLRRLKEITDWFDRYTKAE